MADHTLECLVAKNWGAALVAEIVLEEVLRSSKVSDGPANYRRHDLTEEQYDALFAVVQALKDLAREMSEVMEAGNAV